MRVANSETRDAPILNSPGYVVKAPSTKGALCPGHLIVPVARVAILPLLVRCLGDMPSLAPHRGALVGPMKIPG